MLYNNEVLAPNVQLLPLSNRPLKCLCVRSHNTWWWKSRLLTHFPFSAWRQGDEDMIGGEIQEKLSPQPFVELSKAGLEGGSSSVGWRQSFPQEYNCMKNCFQSRPRQPEPKAASVRRNLHTSIRPNIIQWWKANQQTWRRIPRRHVFTSLVYFLLTFS
jgi:hypothetical protein